MTSIILECAERDGLKSGTAGSWANIFSEDVPIANGDQIAVKQCLINTKSATSGNLILEQDVPIEIDLGFYARPLMNTQRPANESHNADGSIDPENPNAPELYRDTVFGGDTSGTAADNQVRDIPYVLVDWTTYKIDTFTRGTTTEVVCSEMTDLKVGDEVMIQQVDNLTNLSEWDSRGLYDRKILEVGTRHGSPPDYHPYNVLKIDLDSSAFDGTVPAGLTDAKIFKRPTLKTQTFTMTLPAGSYSTDTLSAIISNKMSVSPAMVFIYNNMNCMFYAYDKASSVLKGQVKRPMVDDTGEGTGAAWVDGSQVYQKDAYAGKTILDVSGGGQHQPVFGATQSSMDFKDDRFQFTFFHDPVRSQTGSASPATYNTLATIQYLVPAPVGSSSGTPVKHIQQSSGCFIQSLSTSDFWNRLGFETTITDSNFLMDTNWFLTASNAHIESKLTAGSAITGGSVSNMMDIVSTVAPSVALISSSNITTAFLFVQLSATNDSTGIVASQNFTSEPTGYFLLDVSASFQTDFRDSDQRKGGITAILSKQYNNNDFITCYSESSVPYTHIGNTVNLSNLRLRVIDPTTNEVVQGLGDSNVVFFEIIKASNPLDKNLSKKKEQ